MLLARDRHLCACCAQSFRFGELDMEHIVEKVDKLTVFGGLDGVLKDVVRIQVPMN
jgi:hypothetical protein